MGIRTQMIGCDSDKRKLAREEWNCGMETDESNEIRNRKQSKRGWGWTTREFTERGD